MLYMNEFEIKLAVQRFADHPVLGRATKFLHEFGYQVDANSDGWAYWNRPVRAARQLMELIQHPETATDAALKRAITPIKAFYTRHGNRAGMKFPEGE